jgi:23S rRNA (cytidine1920-2'-O)/16S rRNA (cytidine1409-2'-O)-methyltransferase
LDAQLVARGLVESRSKAVAMILAGEVYVNGMQAGKPGQPVDPDAAVEIRARRPRFVSRGGEKLARALDVLGIDVTGKTVLDVGASTGGFTDCVLQRGARRVYAVDVGTGQLAWALRSDPRVVALEQRDIRSIAAGELDGPVDLVTIDVVFISLAGVLPAAATLARPDGTIVALVKPQFEVGPKLARRGVVRETTVHRDVLRRVLAQAREIGLVPVAATYSPIAGPKGNLEFFVQFRRRGPSIELDIDAVVAQAHHTVPRRGPSRPQTTSR